MKAVFDPAFNNLSIGDELKISGEAHHHLSNVMRSKVDDLVLLLNGKGFEVVAKIISVEKKFILLKVEETKSYSDNRTISIMVGMPKKEYAEDVIRSATELAVSTIYFVSTEYAQRTNLNEDRVQKIIGSAVSQCNAAFVPDVAFKNLRDIPFEYYQHIILLHNQYDHRFANIENSPVLKGRILIIVGPEGGFSQRDIDELTKVKSDIKILTFRKTNILKTITAVPVAIGWALANNKE
ncbi:MAG: 16S rRNA (uracil(1498)-N(3))-methyltransferase [Bdellovibrio sp.]